MADTKKQTERTEKIKAEQDQEQRIPLSELIDHVTMDGKLDPWANIMGEFVMRLTDAGKTPHQTGTNHNKP